MAKPPVRLCLLDPHRAILETAAQRLLAEAGDALPVDLSGTLVLMPTAQAGRRLREQLAVDAGERGLLAPVVMTPPALWQAALPAGVASELECLFAWREVLDGAEARELLGLPALGAEAGAGAGVDGQIRQLDGQIRQLAQQLQSLRFELAQGRQASGEVLDFAAVSAQLRQLGEEHSRWDELAALEERFREQLRAWNLADPVLAKPQWPLQLGPVKRVILLGLADPMPRLLPWLEELAQEGLEQESLVVESWLAGSEAMAGQVDAWGRPWEQAWAEAEIVLGHAQLRACASAPELAREVVEQVAAWGIGSDELSLGVADTALSESLRVEFEAARWRCFDPQAQQAAVSGILPVLELLRELLAGRIQGLWELASQPGLQSLFPALAEVSAEKLAWLAERWAEVLPTQEQGLQHLVTQLQAASQREDARARAPEPWVAWLSEWVAQLLEWRERFLNQGDAARALAQLGEALGSLDDGAGGAWWRQWDLRLQQLQVLQQQGLQMEAREALSWVLQSMPAVAALREGEAEEIALEFEGWLELGFSSKPYLLICGLHEQVVPAKPVEGAFLHDGLREKLGLRGRAWRFAVDALRLTQILAARDSAQVLLGCVAQLPGGETRLPSRLLLRPSKQEQGALAQRALQLFGQEASAQASQAILPAWDRGELRLELSLEQARADSFPWRRGLSASKLGDYLSCPLRFALKHIWGMERLEWEEHEMNSRSSGNLMHAVVEDFARQEDLRGSEDAAQIEEYLRERLGIHGRVRFGPKPPLPLRLQLRSLEKRLAGFAQWQAAWRSQGWQIVEAEYHLGGAGDLWQIGGMNFEGFVDRIDRHADGRWMIWDYKTRARALGKPRAGTPLRNDSALGELGDAIHWKNSTQEEQSLAPQLELVGKTGSRWKRWVNLQLPLYALEWQARLEKEAKASGSQPEVGIGQIVLGAQEEELGGYQWSEWTGFQAQAVQESARLWAEAAVASIAAGKFWPPSAQPPSWDSFGKLAPDGWERAFSAESLRILGCPAEQVAKVGEVAKVESSKQGVAGR